MNVEQDAFNKIKRIVTRNTLLTYPDFNEIFKTDTDASAFQLGAVITQKGKLIPFYSTKLTDTPKSFTATEKELIITV